MDSNSRFGWAMSQYLPTGAFERQSFTNTNSPLEHVVVDLLQIPDDNEHGFFFECELEDPAEIQRRLKFFHYVFIRQKNQNFTDYMNSVKQPKYKPTPKVMVNLSNKTKPSI